MLEICPDCPNNSRNVSSVNLTIGEAAVVLHPSGGYETFSVQINSGGNLTGSHLAVNVPHLDETYPELAESIAACEEPICSKQRAKGVLGALGIKKTVRTCPALLKHMDAHDATSVNDFFRTDELEDTDNLPPQSGKNRS